MNIQPLNEYILIKPEIENKETKTGIILPDTVDKKDPEYGTIVATGKGKITTTGIRIEPSVFVGNRILFRKYVPTKIKVEGEEYFILEESDILAIIN